MALFIKKLHGVKKEIIFLWILFFLALFVRLYSIFNFPFEVSTADADAIGYMAISKSIIDTFGLGGTSTHFPPFYPFFIALFSLITNDLVLASRLVSSTMGSFLIFPAYLIGKGLYNEKAGYYSAICLVFFDEFFLHSIRPISQMTFLLLLTWGIYFGILCIKSERKTSALLTGVFLGAAYLTRPEALVTYLYTLLLIVIALIAKKSMKKPDKLKISGLVLGGFSMMMIPYVLYLKKQMGVWVMSGKARGVLIVQQNSSARLTASGHTTGETLDAGMFDVFANLETLWMASSQNFMDFAKLVPTRFPISCLFLAALGFVILLVIIMFSKEKDLKLEKAVQLMMPFGFFATLLPVFIYPVVKALSYILPLFPLLMLWFVIGLLEVEKGLISVLSRVIAIPDKLKKLSVLSFAGIAFFSYSSFSSIWDYINSEQYFYEMSQQKFILRDTGVWLKKSTPKEARVMTRFGIITFHADRLLVGLVDADVPALINYAREKKVNYIVVDSISVPRKMPGLKPLLKPTWAYRKLGLMPVYARQEFGAMVTIYELS